MMEILIGPNRTLWYSYDTGPNANPQLVPIARTFTQEHHDLIPYIRSLVYGSTQTGMPAMRMMPLAFPGRSRGGRHVRRVSCSAMPSSSRRC